MNQPKRKRLVPEDGVEVFEIRLVQWFDAEGDQYVSSDVRSLDGTQPTLVEILGTIALGIRNIEERWPK